jgi:hypothetical protein
VYFFELNDVSEILLQGKHIATHLEHSRSVDALDLAHSLYQRAADQMRHPIKEVPANTAH